MNFADWFEANKKYIYGADVDAWCETAWDAGHAAGLQERTPVDMEPVAYCVYFPTDQRQEFCQELDDLIDDLTNLPHEIENLHTAAQLQAAVAQERANLNLDYHLLDMEPVAWMHPSRDPHLLSHSAYTYGSASIPLYTDAQLQKSVAQERERSEWNGHTAEHWNKLAVARHHEITKLETTLRQAREALQASADVPCYGGHPKQEAAIAVIDEVLKP